MTRDTCFLCGSVVSLSSACTHPSEDLKKIIDRLTVVAICAVARWANFFLCCNVALWEGLLFVLVSSGWTFFFKCGSSGVCAKDVCVRFTDDMRCRLSDGRQVLIFRQFQWTDNFMNIKYLWTESLRNRKWLFRQFCELIIEEQK